MGYVAARADVAPIAVATARSDTRVRDDGARVASYSQLLVAMLLGGSTYTLIKTILPVIPAAQVTFARALIAFVALLALVVARGKGRELVDSLLRRPLDSLPVGVLFYFLCLTLTVQALSYLPASVAGLLTNTNPLFLALGTLALARPSDARRMISGVVLALVGVVLVLFRSQDPLQALSGGDLPLIGFALALLNAVVAALNAAYIRWRLKGRDPVVVSCQGVAWGLIPLLAVAQYSGGLAPIAVAGPSTLLVLVYVGVCCTAANSALITCALQHVPAARAAAFNYLIPLVGAALAFLLLGEPITLPLVVGGCAIVAGVALAQERPTRSSR